MLSKTDVIDLISAEPDGYCGLLLLVEPGEWSEPEALRQLSDKLNAYAVFAVDGELASQFPALDAGKVQLRIQSIDPIPAWARHACDRVTERLRGLGITLIVEQIPRN